ncbi:hypothetical protein EDEG_03595 [Edhazardia aedis USNM 41457]|uniref:Endonuclease/exonuclease/phosphatase domain-containing protein n=1 Tax=Edhazardia aedis (strain USNM 41457) TaxID=1003232 RepID=J8ZQG0_EDHAE|nr:hypothetical protein EDEG_03595 [Edhazardia aedis USNM 41457]|eukprot:EJW01938.1 hypothetical protein EDEG_03595 [Edhazardia aedis USNM 41457]
MEKETKHGDRQQGDISINFYNKKYLKAFIRKNRAGNKIKTQDGLENDISNSKSFPIAKIEAKKLQFLDFQSIIALNSKIYSLFMRCNYEYLRILIINSRKLSNLSKNISRLKKLEMISLNNNDFNIFPIELTKCQNLKIIFFKKNQISLLPPEIFLLGSLKVLDVSDNPLSEPLQFIYQQSGLYGLRMYFQNQIEDSVDNAAHIWKNPHKRLGEIFYNKLNYEKTKYFNNESFLSKIDTFNDEKMQCKFGKDESSPEQILSQHDELKIINSHQFMRNKKNNNLENEKKIIQTLVRLLNDGIFPNNSIEKKYKKYSNDKQNNYSNNKQKNHLCCHDYTEFLILNCNSILKRYRSADNKYSDNNKCFLDKMERLKQTEAKIIKDMTINSESSLNASRFEKVTPKYNQFSENSEIEMTSPKPIKYSPNYYNQEFSSFKFDFMEEHCDFKDNKGYKINYYKGPNSFETIQFNMKEDGFVGSRKDNTEFKTEESNAKKEKKTNDIKSVHKKNCIIKNNQDIVKKLVFNNFTDMNSENIQTPVINFEKNYQKNTKNCLKHKKNDPGYKLFCFENFARDDLDSGYKKNVTKYMDLLENSIYNIQKDCKNDNLADVTSLFYEYELESIDEEENILMLVEEDMDDDLVPVLKKYDNMADLFLNVPKTEIAEKSNFRRQEYSDSSSILESASETNTDDASEISEPPVRYFEETPFCKKLNEKDQFFSLGSYNILCDKYATREQFYTVKPEYLLWEYRKTKILEEAYKYKFDILCIQEMETHAFHNFFDHNFRKELNYNSTFCAKSRYNSMDYYRQQRVDGCATFWNYKKFRHIQNFIVEYKYQVNELEKGRFNRVSYKRIIDKDNIAIITVLQLIDLTFVLKNRYVIVVNTHLTWNPEDKDVKLMQCLILMEHLKNIVNNYPEAGVFIAGDFNSLHNSGVYEILAYGHLKKSHPDFMDGYFGEFSDMGYKHEMGLKDTYGNFLPFTNYTASFREVIDYIFYNKRINLISVLGNISPNYFNGLYSLPSAHLPSDHIILGGKYQFKSSRNKKNKKTTQM